MADGQNKAEAALRVKAQTDGIRVTAIEVIAIVISLIWLVGVALFFLVLPSEGDGSAQIDSLRFVMTLMAIFLPIAMVWIAALAARSAKVVREESQRLQVAIDGMRQTYVADRQARGSGIEPTVNANSTRSPARHRKPKRRSRRSQHRGLQRCARLLHRPLRQLVMINRRWRWAQQPKTSPRRFQSAIWFGR